MKQKALVLSWGTTAQKQREEALAQVDALKAELATMGQAQQAEAAMANADRPGSPGRPEAQYQAQAKLTQAEEQRQQQEALSALQGEHQETLDADSAARSAGDQDALTALQAGIRYFGPLAALGSAS